MVHLKVGGYKKEEPKDVNYDLSEPKTGDPVNTEPSTTEPVSTEPKTIEPVNTEPSTTEPISTEPATVAEPEITKSPEVGISNKEPSSLKTDLPEVKPLEMTDEAALNYLNEKWGKEFDSLDNFNQEPQVNPLDNDPYLKGLVEWRDKTGRPIEDYAKFQKNYGEMSDTDVVREYLQMKYPTLTGEELSLEMNRYTPNDSDLDEDVSMKNLELKKLSTSARSELESFKGTFNEPTASKSSQLTPEIQENLKLLDQIKTDYKNNQKIQEDYSLGLTNASNSLETIPLKLSDDVTLAFSVDDQGRKELPQFTTAVPHWKNEDGSWNHSAIVQDGAWIKYKDQMLQLAFEQGVNSGKDSNIKDLKNTTLTQENPVGGSTVKTGEGAQIEGFDRFMGGNEMVIKLKE